VTTQREEAHLGHRGGLLVFDEICPYGCGTASGTHLGGLRVVGVVGVGRVMVVGLPQPSASSTTSSNGRSATRLGKVEAT
jgi:hypothetical protein